MNRNRLQLELSEQVVSALVSALVSASFRYSTRQVTLLTLTAVEAKIKVLMFRSINTGVQQLKTS